MNYISARKLLRSSNKNNYENFSENKKKGRKCQVLFHICYLLVVTILFMLLIFQADGLILKEQNSNEKLPYVIPDPMVGLCNGTCVPNKAYPCIYSTYYPVSFTRDGHWRWDCPFVNKSGVETGVGKIIGMPKIKVNADSSWKATWYGGNQIISDPNKRIHCACYHVGGKGDGPDWLFHSFQIKIIPNGRNKSIEKACGSFTGCPETIPGAFEELDADPYIEQYFGCKKPSSQDILPSINVISK